MSKLKIRLWFWSIQADAIHGIRYALVPALDFCWRKRDAAQFDKDFGDAQG